ncbi:sulfotransferase domain-containing protein [Nocardioides jiangxiensis]|uniref:Sulfotransferase domain-containing protein n=1 Tax=Nocardioides jiangxiensis TaxID=3064524 RepID=A0ABT9B3I2_9ACTN|nr:sulfotransferase domain-containing protein [Nocardioides sp. WY-20]MDO7867856.1 sulfotransferase domain-containing protein [Nocardioides sp. WY-20]
MPLRESAFAHRIRRSSTLRKPAIATYRAIDRVRPAPPGPRVVANSIPKAGTHLVTALLDQLPGFRYSGRFVQLEASHFAHPETAASELQKNIRRVRTSSYMTTHLPALSPITDVLAASDVRTVMAIRDPRALAVSAFNYLRTAEHVGSRDEVLGMFPTDEALMDAIVHGYGEPGDPLSAPPIEVLFNAYAGWLDQPGVLTVRFEDLVGSQGGGASDSQVEQVARILDHIGVEDAGKVAPVYAERIFNTGAMTFHSGTIDGWRGQLAPAHVAHIEEMCGDAMARLGYVG